MELVDEEKSKGGRPKKEIDSERLFQLRREGKSIREIAKELKVSKRSLYGILREGKKVKKGAGRSKKEIDSEKLLQLKEEGKPIREIAKELNISHTSVRRELNKLEKQQNSSK